MKYSVLLLLILSLFFQFSCKEKNVEKPDTQMIIGDSETNVTITTHDTIIFPLSRCDPYYYNIDLDGDSIDDFSFYSYYCYGMCIWYSEMRIDCLSDSSYLVRNDTIPTVQILYAGDTLSQTLHWESDNFVMLTTEQFGDGDCGGDGIFYVNGIWRNIDKKYIGCMIKKEDHVIYGWLEVNIKQSGRVFTLELSRTAYKMAAYDKLK